jgi:hypothetical protein
VLEQGSRVPVRSYRLVFRLERRIYKLDRWRVPLPGGLPVRALVYAAAVWGAVVLLTALPGVGYLLELLPPQVHWGVGPGIVVFLLLNVAIDGRPPHRALAALLRWRLSPRCLSGLRPCPRPGSRLSPVGELAVRPDWRGPSYRPGRVHGPATLLLRYEAQGRAEDGGLVVRSPPGARAVRRGRTITVPPGGEVVFR